MKVKRIPLIAGNWKMNQNHLEAILLVQKLSWILHEAKHDTDQVETAIFPPFTDLRSVQTIIAADKLSFSFGAQDLSAHDSGAFTGEISGAFLAKLDCKFVLVGHSERRTLHGETDDVVAQKVTAALKHSLIPVLCVGETAADLAKFGPSATPVAQVQAALQDVKPDQEVVIAYEPVWAIGSGQAATPDQAEQVAKAIRAEIRSSHGDDFADRSRILYGGSVKSTNIASFLREPNLDGALVGGASLDAQEFAAIIQFHKHVTV